MDFHSLMNMAASKQENLDKHKVSRYSLDLPAPRKEEKPKAKSEAVQKLIKEKEMEKRKKEEAIRKKREQEEKEEKKRNHFKIPKKKAEPAPTDTEKLINSLFDDDNEADSDKSASDEDRKDKINSQETCGNDGLTNGLHSSKSHKDKSDSSRSDEDKRKSSSDGKSGHHRSSSSSQKSSSTSDRHKSSSSDHHKSSSSDHHKSSSSDHKSSSSNHKSSSSSSSSSKHKSSSSDRHKSSSSSSSANKSSSSHSSSGNHKLKHSSSDKAGSPESNRERSSSSSNNSSRKDKHQSSSSSRSSKPHLSSSSSKSQSSSSEPKTDAVNGKSSTSPSESQQPKQSHAQPVVLSKHHLNPLIERQAAQSAPAQLSEREKILARLQAIKERTLAAIHKENDSKGKRGKRDKGLGRKSKDGSDKLDEKAKSAEIVRDVVSSDEDETVDNALDIMLNENKVKIEKEKIARMAKQAWERATKKDSGDAEERPSRKRKSIHKSGSSSKHRRPGNHVKRREHSLSPLSDRESKPKFGKQKKTIVKHSGNAAPPPMDFKALLAMAEQKQNEPMKPMSAIPKKKKKEEEKRPMTQEEKDRKERIKSREYQEWLKNGGKAPCQKDMSDDEASPPSTSQTRVPPSSSSSSSRDKLKSMPSGKPASSMGTTRPSFHKQHRGEPQRPPSGSNHGLNRGKANSVPQMNENVLVCGPGSDSEPEEPPAPQNSMNPFDRIVSQVHKKSRPRPPPDPKRMRLDDDFDEEEEDSDMDDFIDDGEADASEISKEIQKMFGYDRSRFKNEREEDLSDMEADFSTVMKEEKRSAKLGRMEDLEDMRMEQEELRQKALMKKQMKRKK